MPPDSAHYQGGNQEQWSWRRVLEFGDDGSDGDGCAYGDVYYHIWSLLIQTYFDYTWIDQTLHAD